MTGSTATCPSSAPPPADGLSWKSALLTAGCRCVLAAVFLMAALTKVTDPDGFRERVLDGAHLPPAVAVAVVRVLPWLELTCGLCLALGYAAREAALVAGVLLVLFLGHGLVNYAEPDCGCFLTPLAVEAAWWPPVRNAVLVACAVRVLWPK